MSKQSATLVEIVGRLVTDPQYEKEFNMEDFFLRNKDYILSNVRF